MRKKSKITEIISATKFSSNFKCANNHNKDGFHSTRIPFIDARKEICVLSRLTIVELLIAPSRPLVAIFVAVVFFSCVLNAFHR